MRGAPARSGKRRAAGLTAKRSRQAGFSLIELLIAILILMFGVVAVAEMVPAAIRSDFRNRYDSTALIIAQRQLEQMAAQDMTVGRPNPTGMNEPYMFNNAFLPPADPDGAFPPASDTMVSSLGPPSWCYLGLSPPVFPLTVPVGSPPPPPNMDWGADLVPGTLTIDWTAAQEIGYWNAITTAEGYTYETRWNISTFYGNVNGFVRPVGKRIIISTRGGPPGLVAQPTTLVTVVGWRTD